MNPIDTILSSPCGHLNSHLAKNCKETAKRSAKKVIKARNDCPQVQKMHWDLKYWCLENNIEYQKEYKFSKRKFRFDFSIKDHMIGIEYDGLQSEKSGHTTLTGYTSDAEKINLAQSLGWRVLRYSVLNYENMLQDIINLIKK